MGFLSVLDQLAQFSGLGLSQARLEQLFQGITLIRILESGGEQLAEIRGDRIGSLRETLRLSGKIQLISCLCWGEIKLQLFFEGELRAELGYVHKKALNYGNRLGRAYLADGNALTAWLDRERIEHSLTPEASQRRQSKLWWAASPPGVQPGMTATEALAQLQSTHPAEVVTLLFDWLGTRPFKWRELDQEQTLPLEMLKLLPLEQVRAASRGFSDNQARIWGASYFWWNEDSLDGLPESSRCEIWNVARWGRSKEAKKRWLEEPPLPKRGVTWSEFSKGNFSYIRLERSGLLAVRSGELGRFSLDSGTFFGIHKACAESRIEAYAGDLLYMVTDSSSGKVNLLGGR